MNTTSPSSATLPETTPETKNQSPPHPAPTALGTKMMRSVLVGGLRCVAIAPVPFIMTPLILHRLGVAGYGTWAVFLAINGLTSLADLGLMGTVSKFVAEYHARQDFAALARLLNSGLALFLLLDLLIGAGVWLLSPLLAGRLFRGSTVAGIELVFLLRCFLIVIAANILTQLFASVTTGLHRMDLTNILSAANILVSALLGAFFLLRGWGLRGLVCGYAGSGILTVLLYLFLIRLLLPRIAWNPLRFDRGEARRMFSYSLRLYVTQASVAVQNQIEKVLLATMVGVAPVGWYEIASDVALKARGSIGFVLGPVLPAASELHALGDEPRIRELYYRAHKYLALLGVPIVGYVVAMSSRLVDLWLGPSMGIVALPLSILLIVNYFNLATGPGFLIFAGSGYLKPGIQSAALSIVLSVILSCGLIYKFGFAGAVLGTSASSIIGSSFFIALFHRRTGYPLSRILTESYLKPVCCSALLLAMILSMNRSRTDSWFGMIWIGAAYAILYLAAILLTGFFDKYDWRKMNGLLAIARGPRRIVIA